MHREGGPGGLDQGPGYPGRQKKRRPRARPDRSDTAVHRDDGARKPGPGDKQAPAEGMDSYFETEMERDEPPAFEHVVGTGDRLRQQRNPSDVACITINGSSRRDARQWTAELVIGQPYSC